MKPTRDPTKIVLDNFGREREVKISELCQYCPNVECEGFYRRDAPRSCLTFQSWRKKQISLEQAIQIKIRQNKRHMATDEARDDIYSIFEPYCFTYEDRSLAGSLASALIKGEISVDKACKEFGLENEEIRRVRSLV